MKQQIKVLILSPNPDSLMHIYSSLMGAPQYALDQVKIDFFVELNPVSELSALHRIAKEQHAAIIEGVRKMAIPFLNLVQGSEDADIIMSVGKQWRTIQNQRRRLIVTGWRLGEKGRDVRARGFDVMEKNNITIDPLDGIKAKGLHPTTEYGHKNPYNAALCMPGFLKECATLITSKSVLANVA